MNSTKEIQALVDRAMADMYAPAAVAQPAQVAPEWTLPGHEMIDVSTITPEELATARLDPNELDIFR